VPAYDTDGKWIKSAFENTDLGYPPVVSVVPNGYSGDCSGERMDYMAISLQIVRKGDDWCPHYSGDGKKFNRGL
jgi:hypothetical protein